MNEELLSTNSEAFSSRLGSLLRECRRNSGRSVGQIASSSDGRFSRSTLRQVEAGRTVVETSDLTALAELYNADLSAIAPSRVPIEVESDGVLRVSAATTAFDPSDETSLLTAYLRVVRRLRDAERAPTLNLRRIDIEILAATLDLPGEVVVDRLGLLMGATQRQRGVLVGSFAAGAAVIGLGSIMLMAGNGSPEAISATGGHPGSGAPTALTISEDSSTTNASASASAVDIVHETMPIFDPVMEEEIDDPAVGGEPEARPEAAGGTAAGDTSDDDSAADDTAHEGAESGDDAESGNDAVSDDAQEDDTNGGAAGDDAAGDDAASDGSSAESDDVVEEMAISDSESPVIVEAQHEPTLHREPVMMPMPAPDPMVGREPVMMPMPLPDPIVSREPVMMPMPAPDPMVDREPMMMPTPMPMPKEKPTSDAEPKSEVPQDVDTAGAPSSEVPA